MFEHGSGLISRLVRDVRSWGAGTICFGLSLLFWINPLFPPQVPKKKQQDADAKVVTKPSAAPAPRAAQAESSPAKVDDRRSTSKHGGKTGVDVCQDKGPHNDRAEHSRPRARTNGDDRLPYTIVVKDVKEDVRGVFGEMLRVNTDGSWTRNKVAGTIWMRATPRQTIESGKLSPENLSLLARELIEHNLCQMPKQLGQDTVINRHIVVIQHGPDKPTVVMIDPNETLTQSEPPDGIKDSDWNGISRITKTLALVTSHDSLGEP